MGITKTPDGRYLVGKGISDANNYKGALGKRDILIQYTADGVTPDSMNSLLYLVDYATSHGEANELIVPPGISVWVAKNDKLTAVEADDIYIDDDAFHIGPISYDGSDWTFGDPTDTGGSFPTPTEDDNGKILTAGSDGTASWQTSSGGGEVFTISQGLTTALLACVQTAVGAAVTGADNLAYGADSGQQLSSEVDTESAFAAAKSFFEGGSVKLSFPGVGVKLSPTMAYWSDSDPGYELNASIGGIIPAYSIPWVGIGFVQWNMNVACQLDGDDNPLYGYDIYVAVSINKDAK